MANKQAGKPIKAGVLNSEATATGTQYLMSDVAPITQNDRMTQKCAAPMVAKCLQNPCDIGMFNSVQRNQIDLLDYLHPAPVHSEVLTMTPLIPTNNQQE